MATNVSVVQRMQTRDKKKQASNPNYQPVSYSHFFADERKYYPPRDSNTTYPTYPSSVVANEVKGDKLGTRVSKLLDRSAFPPNQTQGMTGFLETRAVKYITHQDEKMLLDSDTKMSSEKISRNHKLADSSVRALVLAMWVRANKKSFDPGEETTILNFFNSIKCSLSDAKQLCKRIVDAGTANDAYLISSSLQQVIDSLSHDYHNLRFGDSDMNERILFAFDPNVHTDGSATPLSEGIISAGKKLATMLGNQLVDACFQQALDKTTGQKLSSSMTTI